MVQGFTVPGRFMSSPVASFEHASAASRLTLPIYVTALGLSAFLLFGVQPMFAKMVLPVLGGSPGVWSVATVVFQSLLLAGYAYAHWLARRSTRTGALIHLALMALAATALPIAVGPGWRLPPTDGEEIWLVGLFLAGIGLPFLAIAGNGPLLQAWFSRSGHAAARDPYFLYAASNIGSFAALAAYPVLIEPALSLREQSYAWASGFALLAVLIAACGACAGERVRIPRAKRRQGAPTWTIRSGWMAISFVSSGLIVAVTAHISTDIAAVPLLWVLPLALYLLSFVLAFRSKPILSARILAFMQAGATAIAILGLGVESNLWTGLALHVGLFFVNALICHGTLHRTRPSADHLTDFYLCMSLGGALGGIFGGLVAPSIFPTVFEYPILLAGAFLCRPSLASRPDGGPDTGLWRDGAIAIAACLMALCGAWLAIRLGSNPPVTRRVLLIVLASALIITWRRTTVPAAFTLSIGLVALVLPPGGGQAETVRSFFGVHRILTTEDGRFRLLAHGTTVHGAIRIREEDGSPARGRPEPTTYYTTEGAIATAVRSVRDARGGRLGSVSLIGLGAGSMACHAPWNERWTFYEIDPEVARIARDPARFRFLSDCAPDLPVVLGDARLTLANAPAGQDVILLDAFSSDAIPVHLVTREAFGLYLSKLGPEGAIVVHVSNRHLDLTRILARIGAEYGLVAFKRYDKPDEPYEARMRSAEIVVALARRPHDLGPIGTDPGWERLTPDLQRKPWTDDYSNLFEALLDARR